MQERTSRFTSTSGFPQGRKERKKICINECTYTLLSILTPNTGFNLSWTIPHIVFG